MIFHDKKEQSYQNVNFLKNVLPQQVDGQRGQYRQFLSMLRCFLEILVISRFDFISTKSFFVRKSTVCLVGTKLTTDTTTSGKRFPRARKTTTFWLSKLRVKKVTELCVQNWNPTVQCKLRAVHLLHYPPVFTKVRGWSL